MNLTDMIHYMIPDIGAHINLSNICIKTSRMGMQREIKLEKVFAKKLTNGLRYLMIKMHRIVCYLPVKKFLKIQKQMLLKYP